MLPNRSSMAFTGKVQSPPSQRFWGLEAPQSEFLRPSSQEWSITRLSDCWSPQLGNCAFWAWIIDMSPATLSFLHNQSHFLRSPAPSTKPQKLETSMGFLHGNGTWTNQRVAVISQNLRYKKWFKKIQKVISSGFFKNASRGVARLLS